MSCRAIRIELSKRNIIPPINFSFVVFVCGLGFAQGGFADDSPDLPSVITLTSGTDSDNGSQFYLDSDIALPDGQRLSLTAGKINLGSQNQYNAGLDPLVFNAGLDSKPGMIFPVGIEYEFWGEEGQFTIHALRGSVGYNHKWFSFTARPQAREFTLYFNDSRKLKFSSKGYNLQLGIHGFKNLLMSLGYTKNDYDFTVFKLASFLISRQTDVVRRLLELRQLYIADQRLQSASNFDDRIYNAGLSYYFSWGDLGAYWIRSRSVFKDPDSGEQILRQSYGISGTIDLSADWSLGLVLDSQTISNDDSTFTSGSVSLSYYW